MNATIPALINALRCKMLAAGISLTVIPHTDPHQSEYMSPHWHVRQHFSGFSGSAGTLVVTDSDARLWTDSRYFLQASSQLEGTGISLMREGLPETPSINTYIINTLAEGKKVGIDGRLFSIAAVEQLESVLEPHGITVDTGFDPAEGLWNDRPPLPADPAFVHMPEYAGEDVTDKMQRVLVDIAMQQADSYFTGQLDEIAWVLNIRGSDVAYNPVVTSYLYISPGRKVLFIDRAKVTPEVASHLASSGVDTLPYVAAAGFISELPANERVLAEIGTLSSAFAPALDSRLVRGTSPVAVHKAVRNPRQQEMIRRAMVRDGVAMANALSELFDMLSRGERATEMTVDRLLTEHRSRQPLYFDNSFPTIAGYGPHGAIVHYEADEASDAELHPCGLLLIDSGAQYLDATTDITRTISLGAPTPEEIHDFTLVLQGNIDLADAVFPEGTRGAQLDALARMPLWREGKTYLHGTGHGVGHFLNVHEGPQKIRKEEHHQPLLPGMLTSDEPGLYLTGRYGIRCENLLLTVEGPSTEAGQFLCFETVTLFPFDRTLIDTSMLTPRQRSWLNAYHATVFERLSPHLGGRALEWLREACAEI